VDRTFVEHSVLTGIVAAKIAADMGLSASDTADAAAVGMLHEAGMLHVQQLSEDDVLQRSDAELRQLHQRERSAAIRVVQADERIADLAQAVGSFFDDTPTIVGRVVVVADAFAYLVREWGDRPALPPLEALRIIDEGAGVRYDGAVVSALSSLIRRIRMQV
jgi:HD-GYP domain-containing protein (c-di-GMP phosphodiesterase class II)